jgi:hypothetical protein
MRRKVCRIKNDLLNGNDRNECPCLPHSWPLELEKGFFRLKRRFLDGQMRRNFRGPW